MYSGGGLADIDILKAYLVATKDLTPMSDEWEWTDGGTQILGTVGILYIDIDPDGAAGDELTEPFVGLQFVGASGTSLGLEYRTGDDNIDQDDVFSAVLTHPLSPVCEVQVGTTNAGPSGLGLDDQDVFVRLGYIFPIGGE
jgi:hypothetical protein